MSYLLAPSRYLLHCNKDETGERPHAATISGSLIPPNPNDLRGLTLMPTIALVDDDRNILTSLRMVLEAEGYKTQTYNDGASALDGLSESPPDLAILDIKMPRMDGMELLRRLR